MSPIWRLARKGIPLRPVGRPVGTVRGGVINLEAARFRKSSSAALPLGYPLVASFAAAHRKAAYPGVVPLEQKQPPKRNPFFDPPPPGYRPSPGPYPPFEPARTPARPPEPKRGVQWTPPNQLGNALAFGQKYGFDKVRSEICRDRHIRREVLAAKGKLGTQVAKPVRTWKSLVIC